MTNTYIIINLLNMKYPFIAPHKESKFITNLLIGILKINSIVCTSFNAYVGVALLLWAWLVRPFPVGVAYVRTGMGWTLSNTSSSFLSSEIDLSY